MPFDFAAVSAPFRMQPGLRRLAPGEAQLTPATPGDAVFLEKLAALRDHPQRALVCAPGFDATPALRALLAQAAAEHPDAFVRHGDLGVEARRLGWAVRGERIERVARDGGAGPPEVGAVLRALPGPWRLPGLLSLALAEDFAVIDGRSARIPWLAVCLPSRWAPEEKVGRHFAEVHAPVADNGLLLAAADHLTRLVTGTERWQREVWTVSSDPHLAQHPRHAAPAGWPAALDAGADALAAHASFRTEHQTFIPVPNQQQAVFTIRVESRPLAVAIDTPQRARAVHDAIESMSDAVLAYRGLTDARARLLAWLAARSA